MSTKYTKVFFDTEFTGLHQDTTLISIGFTSECGKTFYAELNNYDKNQINDWLKENVLKNLIHNTIDESESYLKTDIVLSGIDSEVYVYGNSDLVRNKIVEWLNQFGDVKIWSDCLAYDWMLFNNLLADYNNGYPQLPSNIYYIPFDICTLFEANMIDPDISREEYLGLKETKEKHNALYDAIIIKDCYKKLTNVNNNDSLDKKVMTDYERSLIEAKRKFQNQLNKLLPV